MHRWYVTSYVPFEVADNESSPSGKISKSHPDTVYLKVILSLTKKLMERYDIRKVYLLVEGLWKEVILCFAKVSKATFMQRINFWPESLHNFQLQAVSPLTLSTCITDTCRVQ